MSALLVKREGATTRLTLNRPEKANALDAEIVEALHAAVAQAHTDDTRLLVLRANGRNFCAGFDFTGFEAAAEAELLWRFVRIEQLLQSLYHAPFATLALAQGRNIGAGADLIVACESRVAAPDATFRMPGLAFGLQLGTRRLGQRIGADRARALLAGLHTLRAEEALAQAFVTELAAMESWPAVEARAANTAAALAPPARQRLNRATVLDTRATDMADLVASVTVPGLKDRIRAYRSTS
jgi:enoyl-CoA hydratase/carnithine racemase